MQKLWKIILPLLVVAGLVVAVLTQKGVINAEIPVDYNPDPYPLTPNNACPEKGPDSQLPQSPHATKL